MTKIKKILILIALVPIFYLLAGFFIAPMVLKNQLIKNLDEKLTLKSEIEKISFNPITFEITINNYKLIDKNNEESTIFFKKLSIDIAFFKSLYQYEINLENILLDELVLNIKEEKDGFNVKRILKENDKNENQTSLKWFISQLKLSNSNINITNTKLYTIHLKEINYSIENLSNYNTIAKNNLTFKINQSNISSNGNIKLNPFDLNGKLTIENLKIKDLSDFKTDLSSNFSINEEANINSNINYKIEDLKKIAVKIDSDNINFNSLSFNFIDTNSKIRVKSSNSNLTIKDFIFNNEEYKIGKIELNNPNIFIIMPKIASSNSKTNTQINKEKKGDELRTKFNISSIVVQNGTLNFEDKNLPIPFKTTISKLNGTITQIDDQKTNISNLKIDGTVDKYGVANITAIFNPNNIKFLTDINLKFKNITLKNFTPYSGKFLGRELKSGKLDLDLKYNIDKSNLAATNNITITKLELGKNIKSKDAVSLPLEVAISLLEDENGVINMEIPVYGNVDSPEFSINSIVWKAFTNLISKSITAPFTFLANALNFDENEITTIKFDLNEYKITPTQKENLDKIVQILKNKKNFTIEIFPSYKKDKENEKIAIIRATSIKEYLSKTKSIKKEQIIINSNTNSSNNLINIRIK